METKNQWGKENTRWLGTARRMKPSVAEGPQIDFKKTLCYVKIFIVAAELKALARATSEVVGRAVWSHFMFLFR